MAQDEHCWKFRPASWKAVNLLTAAQDASWRRKPRFRCDALRHLCSVYPSPGICSELLHLYEAISPMPLQDPRPMDPDEDITLQWISLDEAQDMLDHGAIMDAKTIITLQHALLRR